MQQIGVVEGAIGGEEQLTSLAALFPHLRIAPVGPTWPDQAAGKLDILIVSISATEVDQALSRLKDRRGGPKVIIVLRDADVMATRLLVRGGAADVLPAPVSEPALALSLERLLVKTANEPGERRKSGHVVAMLKAGGGVGATALAVQMGAALAAREEAKVCLADLDLQFGIAGLYLDLPEAISVTDLLGGGAGLGETQFLTALAAHRSGLRLLAGPKELVPLETLGSTQVDSLVKGLRREFAMTLVDLPSVWTAWTNRLLSISDRIVLVTHLTVPHIKLVKRQLQVLATQHLDDRPLTLVCNCVSRDQLASVPIKAAEKSIGRPFDVVIPEDSRTMTSAINQGVELAEVRRGTQIEKSVVELADKVADGVIAAAKARRRW